MISRKDLLQGAAQVRGIDNEALIASLNRELDFRLGVYPRLVEQGKMTVSAAEWEIACTQRLIRDMEGALF